MPRNSSGNYVLPSGNPVVEDTLIEAAWANLTMGDLAEALTDSLDRNGRGGMLAPFRLADGVLLEPGLSFANEPSLGLLRGGANDMRATVLGVPRMRWTAAAGTQNWDGSAWRTLAGGAYREVTESQTDTTAGRLLKVGDFGLGAATPRIVASTAEEAALAETQFYIATTGTDTAFDDRGIGIHLAYAGSTRAGQLWFRRAATPATYQIQFRGVDGGGYGAPVEIYHQGSILGLVSQASGVPTGAIIERGSNANGQFVRFADGTLVQTKSGFACGTATATWTFPVAFAFTTDAVLMSTRESTSAAGIVTCRVSTVSSGAVRSWAADGTALAYDVDLLAIGRWF